ncbi:hypothetical protein JCM1841_004116 [Sporobolomyces salmonicolor]
MEPPAERTAIRSAPRSAPLPLVVSSSSHLPTPPSSSSPASSPIAAAASVVPPGKRKRNRRHVCVYVDCEPVYPDESTGSLEEQLDEAHREIQRLQRVVDELSHVQEEEHAEDETLLSPLAGQPSLRVAPPYGTPHSHVHCQYPPDVNQQQRQHYQEPPQSYYDTRLAPPPALQPLPLPYALPIPPSSPSSSYAYAASYPSQRVSRPDSLSRPPPQSRSVFSPPAMPAAPAHPLPPFAHNGRDGFRYASVPQPGSGGIATEQERERGNAVGDARRGLRG